MPEIRAADIVAFYLFDCAESVALKEVPRLLGGPAVPARLAPKPATPAYVQYDNPPLSFEGESVGVSDVEGFRARVRVYDYGVISVALTRPFAGSWDECVALGQTLIESPELEARAEDVCRLVMVKLKDALKQPREALLSEDYLVVAVTELDRPRLADELMAERGDAIAALLRGERHQLSSQEKAKVLQERISYLADDLVVAAWNAAFVYDTAAGVQAALEILEFANSQLLELRYYDRLLDEELAAIYARLQRSRWFEQWVGGRHTRAARHVQALLIDINELTDRTQNTVKFIGDLYAVRLFRLVAERLDLDAWKAEVEGKIRTLDDLYRFAVEQSSTARGNFMEFTIVLILVLELFLILIGVMN